MNRNEKNESSSSPPSSSHSTAQSSASSSVVAASAINHSKWSNSLDDLINDETGRKLFSYFLKSQFNNDNLLMLYMIFKCLPECANEEQLKKMLKCTYNTYFKSSHQIIKSILGDINDDLGYRLQNKQFDLNLILEAKARLRAFLDSKCFKDFLSSQIYAKCVKLLQNERFSSKLLAMSSSDEQAHFMIDVLMNEVKYLQFCNSSLDPKSPSTSIKSFKQQKSTPNMQLTTKSKTSKNKFPNELSLVNSSKKPLKSSKSQGNMPPPPNPYHTIGKIIPVSALDSELQSISSDALTEDSNNKRKPKPKLHSEKYDDSTTDSSSIKSLNRNNKKQEQLDITLKNPQQTLIAAAAVTQVDKRPIAESNPRQFADIVSKKLEDLILSSGFAKSSSNMFKESSDVEAERMIDEHINRVFKSSNEQTPLSVEPSGNFTLQQQQQQQQQKSSVLAAAAAALSSASTSDRQSLSTKNYDSGISVKSVTSIERVNHWLENSASSNTATSATVLPKPQILSPVKTTVAYYLPGEEVAYISTFPGKELTLAQFKHLITKKGNFRYFFKTKSDLLGDGEECIAYIEVTDDYLMVPMFNNKVIAKIEKANDLN